MGSPIEIEETTRLWAERLWRRWGRRCRRSNKYFEVYPGHTTWCVASRDLDPAEVQPAPGRSRRAISATRDDGA